MVYLGAFYQWGVGHPGASPRAEGPSAGFHQWGAGSQGDSPQVEGPFGFGSRSSWRPGDGVGAVGYGARFEHRRAGWDDPRDQVKLGQKHSKKK